MNFKQTVTNFGKVLCSTFLNLTIQTTANAYPFAQQGYPNPREANGRIVCANCHLAENL
jgi:apocytochrome f